MTQNKYQPRKNRGYGSFNKSNKGYKSGSNRYSNRSKYSGKNFRKSRKNPYMGSYIDEQMFISEAQPTTRATLYVDDITYEDFKLNGKLKHNIKKHNYIHPTKIQAGVIDEILNGKDVLGLASTGSGKTAAFLIPLINIVANNTKKKCLIVAPTRELVNQIQAEYKKFSEDLNIKDVLIVGGASYSTQIRLIKKDPQFIMATPGRLLDLVKSKNLDLSTFDHIVLDEVDRMLDMGFINDVKEIISMLKTPKQSMFLSATMDSKLKEIATSLLINPIVVEVSKQEAAKNVEQDIVRVNGNKSKVETLHEILINTNYSKVLVFAKTKRNANDLAQTLRKLGHQSDALHGNKSLNARTKILAKFKRNEIDILVATDVASRGIDVPDISHVINFDKPATYEDYIHRIGRTGRIGKKGTALTFV